MLTIRFDELGRAVSWSWSSGEQGYTRQLTLDDEGRVRSQVTTEDDTLEIISWKEWTWGDHGGLEREEAWSRSGGWPGDEVLVVYSYDAEVNLSAVQTTVDGEVEEQWSTSYELSCP